MARSATYLHNIVYKNALVVVPSRCRVSGEVWSAIVVEICAMLALGVVDDVGGSGTNMMYQDTLYGSECYLC
jgi:hypothetical protein